MGSKSRGLAIGDFLGLACARGGIACGSTVEY
jgi:hypothetical protein